MFASVQGNKGFEKIDWSIFENKRFALEFMGPLKEDIRQIRTAFMAVAYCKAYRTLKFMRKCQRTQWIFYINYQQYSIPQAI